MPDGEYPYSPLTFDGAGNLYGTTFGGGGSGTPQCWFQPFNGCGTVFELQSEPGGWTEKVLYNFQGYDGMGPGPASVVLDSKGNLFGVVRNGGNCLGSCGTLFELIPGEGGLWTEETIGFFGQRTGASPGGLIIDSSDNLYGTTEAAGPHGNGDVFRLTPTQNGFEGSILYGFTGGKDGDYPLGLVAAPNGTLFGVNFYGGKFGDGTIFEGRP